MKMRQAAVVKGGHDRMWPFDGRVLTNVRRPITNRPQVDNLPHIDWQAEALSHLQCLRITSSTPPMMVRPGIGTPGMDWYEVLVVLVTCRYGCTLWRGRAA